MGDNLVAAILKAHLVFSEIEKDLLEIISKYCQVTSIHMTIDKAILWAKNAFGEPPDLIMVNCGEYFEYDQNKAGKRDFLMQISDMKANQPKTRIVLLLPERLFYDIQLIKEMLEVELYNFWFLDSFDEEDIIKFIFSIRSLTEVEEYLQSNEEDKKNRGLRNFGILKNLHKVYEPYFVKSNVIAFFSEDDSILNYGLATLTALELAEHGFKVSLVETICSIPRLASILSVEHPYFNTRHAITMYAQQNNEFIRNCLFNKDIYLNDENSPYRNSYIENYPLSLYLLPDGIRKDNLGSSDLEKYWRDFIMELARITIFENDFSFLIFICQGNNYINSLVMNNVANLKFLTVSMLPGSIAYGINERKKGKGKVHLVGGKNIGYISNQLNEMEEAPFLYPPDNFSDDFLEFIYLKKKNRTSCETKEFINQIVELIGIKNKMAINSKKERFNGIKKLIKYT